MDEATRSSLAVTAADGAKIRELMAHPGMTLLRADVDAATGRLHSRWLLEDDKAKAELVRETARGYELFFNLAKKKILEGDQATLLLKSPA